MKSESDCAEPLLRNNSSYCFGHFGSISALPIKLLTAPLKEQMKPFSGRKKLMKKRILASLVALATVMSFAGCKTDSGSSTPNDNSNTPSNSDNSNVTPDDNSTPADVTPADDSAKNAGTGITVSESEGKVLNIWCWNEEFKGFFEKYYKVPEGVEVKWTINTNDGGVYQQKLDEALLAQATASADDKIDIFLAEADYITKYVNSDYTLDISTIGVKQLDTEYQYTVDAATDTRNGQIKGISFQCCPAGLIYRRSIAKEVLGTDDTAEVQAALSSWDKFDEVAAKAKDLGYYMTASYAETYRTFSNNATSAWVDSSNNLQIDAAIKDYIAQGKKYLENGWTLNEGIWDDGKNAQMYADGKTMCFFGPAWYFNFCMPNAWDDEKGCKGDWAIVEGPQAYFWGGTWLLAANGTDNAETVADLFNAFTANEDICKQLIEKDAQFTNNRAINEAYAADPEYGNELLGGQNDVAFFVGMADNIVWKNHSIYDQLLNEQLPGVFKDYFLGTIDEDTAYANFYQFVNESYPAIVTP